MPQTTEEHMELENDDDDKSDSDKNIDGEVSVSIFLFCFLISRGDRYLTIFLFYSVKWYESIILNFTQK